MATTLKSVLFVRDSRLRRCQDARAARAKSRRPLGTDRTPQRRWDTWKRRMIDVQELLRASGPAAVFVCILLSQVGVPIASACWRLPTLTPSPASWMMSRRATKELRDVIVEAANDREISESDGSSSDDNHTAPSLPLRSWFNQEAQSAPATALFTKESWVGRRRTALGRVLAELNIQRHSHGEAQSPATLGPIDLAHVDLPHCAKAQCAWNSPTPFIFSANRTQTDRGKSRRMANWRRWRRRLFCADSIDGFAIKREWF